MRRCGVLINKYIFHVFLALTLFISLSFSLVSAETTYPQPTALKYINDYTSTVDDSTKEYIISVGKELEDKTGAQEVVVIIDSLQGNDIAAYANGLFRTWGIGQKDKNNGLLILISMKDRAWRVEVGTSLEGAVTDIYSARVMDSIANPRFQEGNYSQGIKDSYSIFADTIAKEYNVTLDKNENISLPADNSTNNSPSGMIPAILIGVLIMLDIIFNRGRITFFIIARFFWFGRGGGGGDNNRGGFGGMGGGSSRGGGSSGRW
jgi:uncharacterized protein